MHEGYNTEVWIYLDDRLCPGDKDNYERWKAGLRRKPANPYADPNSPESVAWREGKIPGLEMQSTTLNLRKECRDGEKGRKDDQDPRARDGSVPGH